MVISSINNLKTSNLVNLGSNNKSASSAYVAPQMMGDTVDISKKAPMAFKQARKVLAGLMLGAATIFGVVSCSNPAGPSNSTQTPTTTTTPTTPTIPTTPAATAATETGAAVESTLQSLNPVIVNTSTHTFGGFSYYDTGGAYPSTASTEDFLVTSLDQTTGIITGDMTDTYGSSVSTTHNVKVSKIGDGFVLTYPNGSKTKYLPANHSVERSFIDKYGAVGGCAILKPGATQGTVSVYSSSGISLIDTLKNFKLKK